MVLLWPLPLLDYPWYLYPMQSETKPQCCFSRKGTIGVNILTSASLYTSSAFSGTQLTKLQKSSHRNCLPSSSLLIKSELLYRYYVMHSSQQCRDSQTLTVTGVSLSIRQTGLLPKVPDQQANLEASCGKADLIHITNFFFFNVGNSSLAKALTL